MKRKRKNKDEEIIISFIKVIIFIISLLIGLIIDVFKLIGKITIHFNNKLEKANIKNKEKQQEIDMHMLDKNEKEEVLKGNADVFNFDEEELEEDDYYYEDEK